MKYSLFAKITLIFLITIILAIGLTRISFLIDERTERRNGVVAGIAAATARDQILVGPVLVIPYTRIVKTLKPSEKDENKIIEFEKRSSERFYLLPTELDAQTKLNTEQVRRSLYHAVVFGANTAFKGRFASEGETFKPAPNEQIVFGEPRLIFGISDPRGILRVPALTWGGQKLDFLPGTSNSHFDQFSSTRWGYETGTPNGLWVTVPK